MNNAKDLLNRVQKAAQKVAKDPRTVQLQQKVKTQTTKLSEQSQVELKKRLNEAAGGLKGLAEKISESQKPIEQNKLPPPPTSPPLTQRPINEHHLTHQSKMSVNLTRKQPVVEFVDQLLKPDKKQPIETPKLQVMREKLSERHNHTVIEAVVKDEVVVNENTTDNKLKPLYEEKPDKMALLREKTLHLATVTKTAGLRYGSSLTQRLEKPKELFLDKPKELLDTRKKGYDAFKGKLVLSRNLWITGAVCGIVAAVVGTFYTYEAILIQRRQKELLNIEIEIKRIELKRLHQLYEDEIRDRMMQTEAGKAVLESERKRNTNSSWIAYLTGR